MEYVHYENNIFDIDTDDGVLTVEVLNYYYSPATFYEPSDSEFEFVLYDGDDNVTEALGERYECMAWDMYRKLNNL